MEKESYAFTGEEITYLMNGIYLQSDDYKIVYSEYAPDKVDDKVVTLTSEDVRNMGNGLQVERNGILFEIVEETDVYEELNDSIALLRQWHKEGREPEFEEVVDAISRLYSTLQNMPDDAYVISVAEKNIPYLKRKLQKAVRKNSELFDKVGRSVIEAYQRGGDLDEQARTHMDALERIEFQKSKSYEKTLNLIFEMLPLPNSAFKPLYWIRCIPERGHYSNDKGTIYLAITENDLEDLQHGQAIRVQFENEFMWIKSHKYTLIEKFNTMDEYFAMQKEYQLFRSAVFWEEEVDEKRVQVLKQRHPEWFKH